MSLKGQRPIAGFSHLWNTFCVCFIKSGIFQIDSLSDPFLSINGLKSTTWQVFYSKPCTNLRMLTAKRYWDIKTNLYLTPKKVLSVSFTEKNWHRLSFSIDFKISIFWIMFAILPNNCYSTQNICLEIEYSPNPVPSCPGKYLAKYLQIFLCLMWFQKMFALY